MTGRYLNSSNSATVGNNPATATAILSPSVGEFWVPSLVVVSTQPFQPFDGSNTITDLGTLSPHCTLYKGATGVLTPNQVVDDTYNGSNDASTILSGTIVQYGESITAVWDQPDGLPIFHDAVMTVVGRSFNNLEELQNTIAPVPGAKFSGSSANAIPWQYRGFTIAGSQALVDHTVIFTPQFTQVELINVQYQVNTSGTVANRLLGVQAVGSLPGSGGNPVNIFRSFATVTQPATLNLTYNFLADGPTYAPSAVITNQGINLPAKSVIPVGFNLELRVINPQSGDTVTGIQGVYRQLKSVAKVTYL